MCNGRPDIDMEYYGRLAEEASPVRCDCIFGSLVFAKHELSLITKDTPLNPDMEEYEWCNYCPKCGRELVPPNV